MRAVRWILYGLAAAALAAALWLAASTIRFVVGSQPVTGTVVAREKVGMRSWAVVVEYPSPGGGSARTTLEGYYNDAAHAPGARVALRVAGADARPAAWEDLAIPPMIAGLLAGVLAWLAALLRPAPKGSRASEEPHE
ncbi:hypothetical protein [Deferrisoma camini]|uniref:hypothetical protein n=1 Tax=Deferrisoma camini TaxID=1035120 RepID=UPI00046D80E0|nr:hypothetical protein [Deferrisoma camini]